MYVTKSEILESPAEFFVEFGETVVNLYTNEFVTPMTVAIETTDGKHPHPVLTSSEMTVLDYYTASSVWYDSNKIIRDGKTFLSRTQNICSPVGTEGEPKQHQVICRDVANRVLGEIYDIFEHNTAIAEAMPNMEGVHSHDYIKPKGNSK